MKNALRQQLQQKRMMKKEELTQDEIFMKEWVKIGEEEKRALQKQQQERSIKLKQNAQQLVEQMNQGKGVKQQAATSKSPLKGTMNEDELRLNLQLLKEIKIRKASIPDTNLYSI